MSLRPLACLALCVATALTAIADPLSKSYPIDFFRDIPSRNLKGLATRSDGRLIAGPVLNDLNGPALPSLLWCLEPAGDRKWYVGSGPEGKIVEVTLDAVGTSYSVRDVVDLDEPQVLALKVLPDRSLLAGTSPNGVLDLIRDGKVVAHVALAADSIFDIVLRGNHAFVATGNPGRIYDVDLQKFAASGIDKERARTAPALAAKGITVFGEIRDRNVRRITWLGDHLIAGSSPRGNIYSFEQAGGPPQILQENRDAEVAALLPQSNGDLYAALVFTATQRENRINNPTTTPAAGATPSASENNPTTPPTPADRFSGRSSVVYFPKNGFPETVVARANLAFYALARYSSTLLIAGGEQGDVLGYDTVARQGLSFAGSDSAQINAIAPIGATADADKNGTTRFLALRNNAPGLAVIDFAADGPRSAETRRLDLGIPGTLGALRIARQRGFPAEQLTVDLRGNLGSDEIEGWSPWTPAERRADGFTVPGMRARNVKLRIRLTATKDNAAQIDNATLYYLPQNRRPQLGEFRIVSANYALIPPTESNPSPITTLSQIVSSTDRDEKRKSNIMNSTVVPQLGNQIVTWAVTDPDNDVVTCTFSIRREGTEPWLDLAVNTKDGYAQFTTTPLEDGVYQTRLVATEQAPRPAGDRLSVVFDTEELIIDNTPPAIAELTAMREPEGVKVTVSGHDALSLLEGADFVFNNGYREAVTQPADGVRDSQTETFVLHAPAGKLVGATSVEVILYDSVGNSSARRATLP